MTLTFSPFLLCLTFLAPLAGAYEYPLQFTPNAGYRGLIVAGYEFKGEEVVGNCSYYTVSGRSGRGGGGGGTIHNYEQTCHWDLYGNLLTVTNGAPAVPAPVSRKGTKVIYASNSNGDSTGVDILLPERGYVSTPGPHYTWLTPEWTSLLYQIKYTFVIKLKSDGDDPVDITEVVAHARLGATEIKSSTCKGKIAVGATCSITVDYDPTKITSTTDVAYDTLHVDLTSNAGEAHDFIQNYIIVVAKI